jgi:hypothetical protein
MDFEIHEKADAEEQLQPHDDELASGNGSGHEEG